MSVASISRRRLAANRRNAKKSTGPRSAAGKANSSCNAITHGLCSDVLLPDEDHEAFDLLRIGMLKSLNPRNNLELALSERIILGYWKLRRVGPAPSRRPPPSGAPLAEAGMIGLSRLEPSSR